jgi:hypothetical protein
MRLVEDALIVNLKLICNSGVSPLEAFILSALEHHLRDRMADDDRDNGYFDRDLADKIAREICFIFNIESIEGNRAVSRLIVNDYIIQCDSSLGKNSLFIPSV